jgi:hypothetical protein
MLHAYVQKFDVTDDRENILRSERGLNQAASSPPPWHNRPQLSRRKQTRLGHCDASLYPPDTPKPNSQTQNSNHINTECDLEKILWEFVNNPIEAEIEEFKAKIQEEVDLEVLAWLVIIPMTNQCQSGTQRYLRPRNNINLAFRGKINVYKLTYLLLYHSPHM